SSRRASYAVGAAHGCRRVRSYSVYQAHERLSVRSLTQAKTILWTGTERKNRPMRPVFLGNRPPELAYAWDEQTTVAPASRWPLRWMPAGRRRYCGDRWRRAPVIGPAVYSPRRRRLSSATTA